VSHFSVEAEYKAMVHTACEMMWLKSLLWELGFNVDGPMPTYCDNQPAIYIVSNQSFMRGPITYRWAAILFVVRSLRS